MTKKLIDKATVRGDASVPENKMDLARTKTLGLLRSAVNSSSLLPDIKKNLYNEEAMVHMIKESESNAGKWREAEILLQSALNTHRDETKQLLGLTAARGESMVSTVSMANTRARNIAYMNVANKKLRQLNVQFYRERELWDKMAQAESDGVQFFGTRMEGNSKNTTADTNSRSSNLNGRGPVTNHEDLMVGNSAPGTLGAVGRAEQAGKHNSSRAKILCSTIHSAAGSTGMAREMSLTHGNMHSSATANDRPLVHHAVAYAPQLAQTAPEFTMLNVDINELRRRFAAQLNHAAIEKQRLEREIQNLRKLKELDERQIAFQNAQLMSASSRNDADHARKIEKLTSENSHLSIRNTALVSKAMQLESDVSSLATTTNKMISMVSKYAEKVQSDDSDYNAADSKLRSHVGTLLETVKETFVVISTRVERIQSGLTNETLPGNRQENNIDTNTNEVLQAEKTNFSTYKFATL